MPVFKTLLNIGGWIFIAVAMFDLTGTFLIYRHEQHFVQSANRTQGTITRMVEQQKSDHEILYFPVFTFADAKGQQQEIRSSSGQYPPAYKVGDTISVLYEQDAPKDAKIDNFSDLWFIPAFFGFFGAIEMILAIVCFAAVFIIRRYEQKSTEARAV
jgi:hypothetical protein